MGMYTELYLKVLLKPDDNVQAILTYMADPDQNPTVEADFNLEHDFFKTERWRWCMRGSSAYFDSNVKPTFEQVGRYWQLKFSANIKNYGGEWEKMLDWLSPYAVRVDGWYRYEEQDENTPLVLTEQGIHISFERTALKDLKPAPADAVWEEDYKAPPPQTGRRIRGD